MGHPLTARANGTTTISGGSGYLGAFEALTVGTAVTANQQVRYQGGLYAAKVNFTTASAFSASDWNAVESGPELYLPTPSALNKWRKAVATARSGGASARAVLIGDSLTLGYEAPTPYYTNGWSSRLRDLLRTRLGGTAGDTIFTTELVNYAASGENRFSTTWTTAVGRGPFGSAAYGTSGTFTVGPVQCDRFRVFYLKRSDFGTATVTLDGGAVASINGTASESFGVATYSTTSGSHTLAITAPAQGFTVIAVEYYDGNADVGGVKTVRMAVNGTEASGFAATTSLDAAFYNYDGTGGPHLTIIGFGTNEWNNNHDPAAHKTSMQSIITRAQLTGDVVLHIPFYPASDTKTYPFAAYVNNLYSLADTNNCAVFDFTHRWGSRPTEFYTGTTIAPLLHLNNAGHWDAAYALTTAILRGMY